MWIFLAANLISILGLGMTLPFILIYLHDSRHISWQAAGAIWGLRIFLVMAGSFAAGILIDRRGPVASMIVGSALVAVGWVVLGSAEQFPGVLAGVILTGVGAGGQIPAGIAIVARLVAAEDRPRFFSTQFGIFNIGAAIGAAIAGTFVHAMNPNSFLIMFGLAALSTALSATLVAVAARDGAQPEAASGKREPVKKGGYRIILSNRPLMQVAAANLIYFFGGIAVWQVGLSPFLKNDAGFSERMIGLLFMINALTVFLLQFVVPRVIDGRPRTTVAACGFLLWIVAFAAVYTTVHLLHGTALFLGLLPISIIVASAESTAPPTLQPLAIDLAPPNLIGRALAIYSKGQAIGMAGGSLLVGFMLALTSTGIWLVAIPVLGLAAILIVTVRIPGEASIPELQAA